MATKRRSYRRSGSKRAFAPKPDVTIFTDASVDISTGAGGWGAWIACDGGTQSFSGGFKDLVMDVNGGEALALANAVHIGVSSGLIRPGKVVMLQSDSMHALARLRGRDALVLDSPTPEKDGGSRTGRIHKRSKAHVEAAFDVLLDLGRKHSLTFVTRHVKGHRQGDGRAWVNRLCDRLAKDAMKRRRDALATQPATEEVQHGRLI